MQLVETLNNQRNVSRLERLVSTGLGTALIYFASKRRRSFGSGLALLAGGSLLTRGLTGYSAIYKALDLDSVQVRDLVRRTVVAPPAIRIHKIITIRRPLEEVYGFCSVTSNLQLAIKSLERIERLADGYQRWYFRAPGGFRYSTDLEITDDRENTSLISWRSRPKAAVVVQGYLTLKRGHTDAETEAHVSLSYEPPLGLFGNLAARTLSPVTEQIMIDALRQLRQVLEVKELPLASAATATTATPNLLH